MKKNTPTTMTTRRRVDTLNMKIKIILQSQGKEHITYCLQLYLPEIS